MRGTESFAGVYLVIHKHKLEVLLEVQKQSGTKS